MIRHLSGRWSLFLLCALCACAPHVAPQPVSPPSDDPAGTTGTRPADLTLDSIVGPPGPEEHAGLPPRSNSDLLREPDLNQTLTDARRLGLISGFQELRRGVLRLKAGAGFARGTSVSYNFSRLRRAYRKSIDYYGDGILEIWDTRRKLGEYTVDGLFLGPDFSQPR